MAYTNQTAFNKVVRHLLRQNRRSLRRNWDGSSSCRYRGPAGRMCAVGCLIPDAQYSELFENKIAAYVATRVPALKALSEDLLSELQTVHDKYPPRQWRTRLGTVAIRHGLKMPRIAAGTGASP